MRGLSLGISLPHCLCGGFHKASPLIVIARSAQRDAAIPHRLGPKTEEDCFAALAMTNPGGAPRQIEFSTETLRQ